MSRILCLIESLGSGGAERQLTGLAVMLKQKGYEVEVCYYVSKDFYRPFLQENGVRSCFLEEAANPRKRLSVLKKYINNYQADTIISYTASPSMLMCLMKAFGAKFNLIVSERSTTQELTRREKLKFIMYRWSNHIVPNSYSQGSYINEHFKKISSKVKVITNFVDTEKFYPKTDKEFNNDVQRIICVGRVMLPKNIPCFMEAISKVLRDGYKVHVDWYGQDYKDSYSEECHNALHKHKLKDVFDFRGPSSNIQNEYHFADVFCLPSIYEGFPNVLCEAMSCGLPVLCSRVSDIPKIVKEGKNGFLFNPLDSEDMAKTIEQYINLSQEKKKEMAQKSREIAVDMFSKDSFINQYMNLI